MEAKDVLKELRQRHNMTQDQLSEKLAVTRQAVSRWENGESVPNPETLKQLSALFDTSINHLTAWSSSWSFSSPICPMSNSLRSRPEPTSARRCRS